VAKREHALIPFTACNNYNFIRILPSPELRVGTATNLELW